MKETFYQIWEKVKEVYMRMELRQRLMLAFLLTLTFGVMIWVISWSVRVDYDLLFANLTPEDAQKVMFSLKEEKIPYKLKDQGRRIDIPVDLIHVTRINMSSENIGVKAQGIGFEIFDVTKLGQTEFVLRSVNWKRAMEGELQKSIFSLNGVDDVKVHLVFPEERIFKEDQKEPSASVALRLKARLNERQIDGITNFIASAVEGLSPSRITIIDQDGRVLSKNFEDGYNEIADRQMQLTSIKEAELETKIQTMLDRVLGSGNSVVRISAVLNFDQVERMTEVFDPEGAVVRSEETQADNYTSLRDSTSTVNEYAITNFEISNYVEKRINQIGDIKRLSASVFVNHKTNRRIVDNKLQVEWIERTPEEIANITASVRSSLGLDTNRGDQLTVSSVQFDYSDQELGRWEKERQDRLDRIIQLLTNGSVVLVLIVLIFVVFSQFKKLFSRPPTEEEIEEEIDPVIEEPVLPGYVSLEEEAEEGFYPEGDEGMPLGDEKIQMVFKPIKDIEMQQTEAMLFQEAIQKFVLEHPDTTVKLIRSWLMETGPSRVK